MSGVTRALALVAVLVASYASAQDSDAAPEAEALPAWRQLAAAAGLPPSGIERLARSGVLLSDETVTQTFSVYVGSTMPVFVTSDSILNAYHVLFEESVRHLEIARAPHLAPALLDLWRRLPAAVAELDVPSGHRDRAALRARGVIGVGLALLGADTPSASGAERDVIAAEVARIEAATGEGLPTWIGPADRRFRFIDYDAFRPRGFYANSESLRRHFRAVRWLQSIPFRVDLDDERAAALALVRAGNRTSAAIERWRSLERTLGELLPMTTHSALINGCPIPAGGSDGAKSPNAARDADAPDDADTLGVSLTVLPFADIPDTQLLDDTSGHLLRRLFPSGLDVAAALGSQTARDALVGAGVSDEVIATIDAAAPTIDQGRTIYSRYLHCLAALFDTPADDVPTLFASPAWNVKNTNTALAGWAQLRHTWTLPAKESVSYFGSHDVEPGFVEPDPEFFARLADLCAQTSEVLERGGAFSDDAHRRDAISELQSVVRLARRYIQEGPTAADSAPAAERAAMWRTLQFAYFELLDRAERDSIRDSAEDPATASQLELERCIREVEDVLREIDEGHPRAEVLPRLSARSPLPRAWQLLERLSRQVESLGHRQLRRLPPTPGDREFLRDYGKVLAAVMLYGGNSYLVPDDDAPRVASVHAVVGGIAPPSYLHVGTARPQVLYVLYARDDGPVLCRGAVLPYREIALDRRLSDDEWMTRLDSTEPPPPPDWVEPLMPVK